MNLFDVGYRPLTPQAANGACSPSRGERRQLSGTSRHERHDRRFETAQILFPREAVIAILYEGQFDVAGAEPFDEFEGMVPGHVGVAHALQDANRQIEIEGCGANQVPPPLLDQTR